MKRIWSKLPLQLGEKIVEMGWGVFGVYVETQTSNGQEGTF